MFNTKKSILNKAKLLCDIEELNGGKYLIKKVYDIPISTSTMKIIDSKVYSILAPMIIYKLIESKRNNENALTLTLINYFNELKVVNGENYNGVRYNKKEVNKNFDVDISNIDSFFKVANEKLRYYLEECLNLLSKSRIIYWQKQMGIKIRHVELINNFDKVQTIIKSESRRASEEETRFVLDCKAEIKNRFNLISDGQISYHYRANIEYHKLLMTRNIVYDYGLYEVYYKDIKDSYLFMQIFKEFNFLKYTDDASNFIIDNVKSSYDNRILHEDEISKLKSEIDYTFLSQHTLKNNVDKLEIKTIKVETFGQHNNHIIESYEE